MAKGHNWRRWLPAMLLGGLVLAACGTGGDSRRGGGTEPSPDGPRTIKVAQVTDIVTLDPADIGDVQSGVVAEHILESLVRRDDDGQPVAALAESWETSPDGLTWTFHLRQGVVFHDGAPLTADVVVWNYNRVLQDPDAPQRFKKQWTSIVEKVEAQGDDRVVFTLKAPNSAFLDLILLSNAGMVVSKANFEKLGQKDAALHPAGTGPFMLERYVPGQEVVLKKNPNYWGEPARPDFLIFRPIAESNTQVIELETGGIHIATKLGLEDLDRLTANPAVKVESVPAYQVRYVEFNTQRPPLDDIRVRKAINYALDVPTIVQSLVGKMGVLSGSAVLPLASWGHPQDGSLGPYPYDPQKARQLLAEAGWTPGPSGVLQKDGQPLKLKFIVPNGRYFADKEMAEVMKKSLTDLGIQVDLQVMEWAPFLDASDAGDFDLCLVGWNQGGPDPSLFLDALVKTGGRANDARNSDPEIDGWLEAAVYTANLEERQMYYRKVLEKVQDLAWYVPLYNENKLAGLRTEVRGYVHTPAHTRYTYVYLGEGR